MTNQFIKQQQELARKKLEMQEIVPIGHKTGTEVAYDISQEDLDTLITQIITNTGEELMKRAEGEKIDISAGKETYGSGDYMDFGRNLTINTLKQHITSVTGATHEK